MFRGDIIAGFMLQDVKRNLQAVFKADDARIERLFTGKPTSLKSGLSHQEAMRYQVVLKKAGILVFIETSVKNKRVKNNAVTDTQKDTQKERKIEENRAEAGLHNASKARSTGLKPDWQLAPVGSVLSDSSAEDQVVNRHIETDHLSVSPQKGHLISDSERQPMAIATVDIDLLEWELTPYGQLLLNASEQEDAVPLSIDISSLSIAESEGDLLKASERSPVKVTEVDTSHIDLLPNGD